MSTRSLRALRPLGLCLLTLTLALSLFPRSAHAACPNLVLLLDQSTSMRDSPQGVPEQDITKSKWGIATSALMALNLKFNGLLPIGYSNFPTADASCTTQGFNVPVGYNDVHLIDNAMRTYPWAGGSTPTCDAIAKLALEPSLRDPQRQQYILLVTDGEPTPECCGTDPVKKTVDMINAARSQNPPIRTFVVGFGKLSPTQHDALNQMATAGGLQDSTVAGTLYYKADDAVSLDAALGRIVKTLSGGDAGPTITCEDGCYGSGCPAGLVCLQNKCTQNLCVGVTCDAGKTCFTDGKTQSCVDVCQTSCSFGSRCDRGRCVADPCSGQCVAGQSCNTATKLCQDDPKCKNVICHRSQGCFNGKCLDNPCEYLTCPSNLVCVNFTGACQPPGPPPSPEGGAETGCSVAASGPAAAAMRSDPAARSRADLAAPLAFFAIAGLTLALRRRRAETSRSLA